MSLNLKSANFKLTQIYNFITFFKIYNYALFQFNNNTHLQKPDIQGIRIVGIIIIITKITEQK